MGQALNVHRLHFAFTITFHYIFPQLTMGLALLLVYLKTKALRTGDEHYNRAARFWGRIFGINFAVGVITGIPMEFQFGTNWAAFSKAAGGVIGQTLAMEGVFSLFSGVELFGIVFARREKTRTHRALVVSFSGFSGLVALGIFHRRDGRMDASSDGLSARRQRRDRTRQLLGSAAEQVGVVAVRTHDAGRCADRMLRDGGGRRVLFADKTR